jgi:hypothetical protein
MRVRSGHRDEVIEILRASKASHLADAVASLDVDLTAEEVAELEAPYTPRADFQGVSDPEELARISAWIGIRPANSGKATEAVSS